MTLSPRRPSLHSEMTSHLLSGPPLHSKSIPTCYNPLRLRWHFAPSDSTSGPHRDRGSRQSRDGLPLSRLGTQLGPGCPRGHSPVRSSALVRNLIDPRLDGQNRFPSAASSLLSPLSNRRCCRHPRQQYADLSRTKLPTTKLPSSSPLDPPLSPCAASHRPNQRAAATRRPSLP